MCPWAPQGHPEQVKPEAALHPWKGAEGTVRGERNWWPLQDMASFKLWPLFCNFSCQALETVPGAELYGPQDGNKHDLNNPSLTAMEGRQENYRFGKGTSKHVTRGIRVHPCLSVPWECSASLRPWVRSWRDAFSKIQVMEVRTTGQTWQWLHHCY